MAFEAQRHAFKALQQTFVVDQDYTFHKELGQGAYGLVVAAKNRRTGEGCAIKKITNIGTKVDLFRHRSSLFPRSLVADAHSLTRYMLYRKY
jgi:serine/threonine protein kinase